MERPEPALAADWPKVYLFAANFQVNLRYPEKGMWRRKAVSHGLPRSAARAERCAPPSATTGAPQPKFVIDAY